MKWRRRRGSSARTDKVEGEKDRRGGEEYRGPISLLLVFELQGGCFAGGDLSSFGQLGL